MAIFEKLLLSALLILGLSRMCIFWLNIHNPDLEKLLVKLNASPLIEPFLGYKNDTTTVEFYSYKIYFRNGLKESGDHFERIYSIPGPHSNRVTLINESKNFSIFSQKISPRIYNLYCGREVLHFSLFNKDWACKN